MFLQRSANKISTMKRFCLCHLLVLSIYSVTLSIQDNYTGYKTYRYEKPKCNKDGFKPSQCLGERRLTSYERSCMWIADSLGSERVCEDLGRYSQPAVLRKPRDFEMMKAMIESKVLTISWIDMTYDGKRKNWFTGPALNANTMIESWDSKIREITKERWDMDKNIETIDDVKCLAAKLTHTHLWTEHFKTKVKYTLRDCSERLPFFCVNKCGRPTELFCGLQLFHGKKVKAHKEAIEFCRKEYRGRLMEFPNKVEQFNKFWEDGFVNSYMIYHLGIYTDEAKRFIWDQPRGSPHAGKRFERYFTGGVGREYEEIRGGSGHCIVFYHHGLFRREPCKSERFNNLNAVCESPLEFMESVRQKFVVHYYRSNKKFFLDEIVRIECAGESIHKSSTITWNVRNPNGTKYIYGTNAVVTQKPIGYKESKLGLCIKELSSSFEFKAKDYYWQDRTVNCYIPTYDKSKMTRFVPRHIHTIAKTDKTKGVTIDLIPTPITKPMISVYYTGYPGKVPEGMNVSITCFAEYSFQTFNEEAKNTMVFFGGTNGSRVRIENSPIFEIRTSSKELSYNKNWYERFKTPTHELSVNVKFIMTEELTGITFDCFGVDVEYHELPKVCKLGDPYCARSKLFGIFKRPPPPTSPPFGTFGGIGTNFPVSFIVFTILSLLLFAIPYFWYRRKKQQLPVEKRNMEKRKMEKRKMERRKSKNTNIVEVDESTESSYADNLGDGTTIISVMDQKSELYSTKDGGSSILGARQTSTSASHTTKSSGK